VPLPACFPPRRQRRPERAHNRGGGRGLDCIFGYSDTAQYGRVKEGRRAGRGDLRTMLIPPGGGAARRARRENRALRRGRQVRGPPNEDRLPAGRRHRRLVRLRGRARVSVYAAPAPPATARRRGPRLSSESLGTSRRRARRARSAAPIAALSFRPLCEVLSSVLRA